MDRRKTDRRSIKPQHWEIGYPFSVDEVPQQCLYVSIPEDCKSKPMMRFCSCRKRSPRLR